MLNAMRHSHAPSPLRLLSPFAAKQIPLGDTEKSVCLIREGFYNFSYFTASKLSKMIGTKN
jgi:hypothetical protein